MEPRSSQGRHAQAQPFQDEPGDDPARPSSRDMSGFAPEGDDATIIVADPRWRGVVRGIEPLLRRVARAAGGGETAPTIVLDDDRAVRTLNHRHRDRNKPTNVLTFMPIAPGHGGDIVLARGVVQREARAMGRPVRDHLVHLVVHGILHLAGHDHHEVGEARRMEMAEAWILGRLGVPNPWKSAARGRDL